MRIQLSDHFTYGKLLRFTLPSIAMMIFTSIYGVVDGFFVSNFAGKTPFAAVNLIMPVLMILSTVGFMFGTGGSAIVATAFGMGKQEEANRYFSFFVYVTAVLGIVCAILGMVFIRPISILLGAEGELLEDCVTYARVVLIGHPFYVLQMLFQAFFTTAEKPKLGLLVTVLAGFTNMILDAVLVGFLPQEQKLAGAAIATAASQLVGGGLPIVYFARKNDSLLHLGKTQFYGKILLRGTVNGSSEFMSTISMSLVSMLYNLQLIKYAGQNGIAAYGVMMYVSMIFSGAFLGYSVGSAPIFSFQNGAQRYDEFRDLLRKSLRIIGAFSICMVVSAELLADPVARLFVGYDRGLMELTLRGFRFFALSFGFMGFAIFASGFFTALNDGLTSALISFLRTMVFQIAAVLLLPLLWGIDGVWMSLVVAEAMAVLLSTAFMFAKRKAYHYGG